MTLQHVPLKLANLNLSKCKVKMLRFRFLPQRGISRILVGISYILSNLQWTYNEWTYEWNSFWSTEGKGELGSGLFWGSETLFFCKDLLCFNKYVWLRVTRVKTIFTVGPLHLCGCCCCCCCSFVFSLCDLIGNIFFGLKLGNKNNRWKEVKNCSTFGISQKFLLYKRGVYTFLYAGGMSKRIVTFYAGLPVTFTFFVIG